MEENVKMNEVEEQKTEESIGTWLKVELARLAIITGGCIVSYKLGAHAMKKQVNTNLSALCLVDPTLKDHILETIKKGQDILKK